jgi:uncharacterized membrane protein
VLSVATMLCGLGLYCLGINAEWPQQGIDIVTQIALGVLYVVGAAVAAYGLYRKTKIGGWSAPRRSIA